MSFESCFKGKKILITGAGRGIGHAFVERLQKYEAFVYALDLNEENLQILSKEFPDRVKTVCVDLCNWNQTKEELEKLPCVDYLINNAGLSIPEKFLDIKNESFDKVVNVNLKAIINVSQVVVKKMIESKVEGSVLNISSVTSKRIWNVAAVYGMTKAAVDHLTQTMANELGQYNIRVNCLNPGIVNTEMAVQGIKAVDDHGIDKSQFIKRYPMKKIFVDMDQLINFALFLLSDLAPMINGNSLIIDGGYCVT